jgi:cell division septation protein DedD
MDPALKHRLIGAAVLSAIAIIFLPKLMVSRDVNDTASSVPLKVPAAPGGDFQTKELPLAAPSPNVPSGGVVGMDTSHPPVPASVAHPASSAIDGASPAASPATANPAASGAAPTANVASGPNAPGSAVPVASPAAPAAAASGKSAAASPSAAGTPPPAAVPPAPAAQAAPQPVAVAPGAPIPAANAGGHYVVSLGTYANIANAQALVASLQAKQLPAYAEAVTAGGKAVTRVRIGPFQQRGDAEAARLKAQQVRTDMPASVTALDAATAAPATPPAPAASTPGKPAAVPPPATKPVAPSAKPAMATAPSAASGKNATPEAAAAAPAVEKPAALSPAAAARGFAVQVSAFRAENEALTLRNKLRAAGFTAFSEKIQADSGTLFRVRIGPAANRDEADHLRTELSAKLGLSGMVVAYP